MTDYRSTISARPGYLRTTASTTSSNYGTAPPLSTSGSRVVKMVTEMSSSSMSGSQLSPLGQSTASAIREAREREKKEISELNDRLADYVEKVRFLEAQNRKLNADLEMLRGRSGKDTTSVKLMFERELNEYRKLIDGSERERDELEKKLHDMQDEIANVRQKLDEATRQRDSDRATIEDLLQTLAGLEAEIFALRKRIALLEEDIARIRKENQRLLDELQRLRSELDQETLHRIDYQNQVQTLQEEIDFIRRVQDQEIHDLQAMASRDTTSENREFFKNELSSAIRDIRAEYDRLTNASRNDMESWYKLKVQEIQTQSSRQHIEQSYMSEEVKRLRSQVAELRGRLADIDGRNSLLEKQIQELNFQLEDDHRSYDAALNDRDAQIRKMREECEALMVELQMLLDTKQSLDVEIAIYRKLLEGGDGEVGLGKIVEEIFKTTAIALDQQIDGKGERPGDIASRMSYTRSAKGNVSIKETSPEGKFIVLENTHHGKEEHIGEWILKRKIDNKYEIVYSFPRNFVLRPGSQVKVWAHGQGGHHAPPDHLIFDEEDSFGVGGNIQTILYNTDKEERATFIQRSSQIPG